MAPLNGVPPQAGANGFIVPTESMHASATPDTDVRRQGEESSSRSDRRSDKPTATPDGAALSDGSMLDSTSVSPANNERQQQGFVGGPPAATAGAPKGWRRSREGADVDSRKEEAGPWWLCGGTCSLRPRDRRQKQLCCGLALLVLFLVVFLPVFFCVIAPLIVRSLVSSSRFAVQYTDVKSVRGSALEVEVLIRLLTPPPSGAVVEATRATAEWEGRHLGSLDLPEMHLSRGFVDIALRTIFDIEDLDAWAEVSAQILRTGKVFWTIQGATTIRSMGMKFNNIPFAMNVDVAGPVLLKADGSSPFRVLSLDFGESDSGTVRMTTSVGFVNTSSTSVASLGNVEFEMSYLGVPVGRMRSVGPMKMNRGENVYTFKGELKPPEGGSPLGASSGTAGEGGALLLQKAPEAAAASDPSSPSREEQKMDEFLEAIGALMSKSLSGAIVSMDARGVYCSEPVFAPAVRSSVFKTPIQAIQVSPRMQAVSVATAHHAGERRGAPPRRAPQPRGSSPLTSMVEGLKFSNMRVEDIEGLPDAVRITAQLQARIANPLGHASPLEVKQMDFKADMHVGSPMGPRVGTLSAVLVSEGPHKPVDDGAPYLGEDESAIATAADDPLPSSSRSTMTLGATHRDGGASMIKRPEVRGPRRLSAAGEPAAAQQQPQQQQGGPAVTSSSWIDATFSLEGTLRLARDGSAFLNFVRLLATKPQVALAFVNSEMTVRADFALGTLVLPEVQLDHELTLDGMGAVDHVSVKSFAMIGETNDGGWLFQTEVVLPSRVAATVALGPLSMQLSFGGSPIGFLASANMTVCEGLNTNVFAGLLKPPETPDRLSTLSAFFSAAVAYQKDSTAAPQMEVIISTDPQGAAFDALGPYLIPLAAKDRQQRQQQQQTAPAKWVVAAMEGLQLQMPVPSLGDVSKRVEDVALQQLEIDWRAVTDHRVPLSAVTQLRLLNPLGPRVLLHISWLSMDAEVTAVVAAEASTVPTPAGAMGGVGPSPTELRVPLGHMKAQMEDITCKAAEAEDLAAAAAYQHELGPIGAFPAVSDARHIAIRAPVTTAMEIDEGPQGPHNFGIFAAAFVEQQTVRLELRGAADCDVETPFGPVRVSQVALRNMIEMPGLGGLSNVVVTVFKVLGLGNLDVFLTSSSKDVAAAAAEASAAPNSILVQLEVMLESASEASAELTDLKLQLGFQGTVIGRLAARTANIRKGTNRFKLQGGLELNRSSEGSVSRLFSAVMTDTRAALEVTVMEARLPSGAEAPVWLAEGIRAVRLRPEAPPLDALFPGLSSRELLQQLQVDGVYVQLDESHPERLSVSATARVSAKFPLGEALPVTVEGASFNLLLLTGDETPLGLVQSQADSQRATATSPTRIETLSDGSSLLKTEIDTHADLLLLEDGAALGRWIRQLLLDPTTSLRFTARGKAAVLLGIGDGVGSLWVEGLQVDRAVSFAEGTLGAPEAAEEGQRGLDPQVDSWRIVGLAADGASLVFEGEASFVSPVPVEMVMPPVALKVRYGESMLATVETETLRLQPRHRRTSTRFKGTLIRQETPQGLEDLNRLAAEALKGLVLGDDSAAAARVAAAAAEGPVLQLEASMPASSGAPLWLREGLDGTVVTAQTDGRRLLSPSLIRSVLLGETEIDVSGLTPSGSLSISANVELVLESFFGDGVPMQIEALGMQADVLDPRTGKAIARLRTEAAPAATAADASAVPVVRLETPAVTTPLPEGLSEMKVLVHLSVDVVDEDGFEDFAISAFQAQDTTVLAEGLVSLDLQTPLGLLSLRGVRMRQAIPFTGLQGALESVSQGLRVLSFSVGDVSLNGADGNDSVSFVVDVMLENSEASDEDEGLQINAGSLGLSLIDAQDGTELGFASVQRAMVGGTSHPLRITGRLFSSTAERKRTGKSRLATFMSRAMNGEPLGVYVRWREEASNPRPKWIGAILDALNVSPSVTGLESSLHLVEGLGFRGLHVGTEKADEVQLSALVDVRVRSPLGPGARLKLQSLGGSVELFAEDQGGPEGPPMAVLEIEPRAPVMQQQDGEIIQVTIQLDAKRDALKLLNGGEAFAEFVAKQINAGPSSVGYKAVVTARVMSPFGVLEVNQMAVTGSSSLLDAGPSGSSGGGLADIQFAMEELRFKAPADGRRALGFAANVTLQIPLDLTIRMGPVNLQLLVPIEEATTPQQEREPVALGTLELHGFHLDGGRARLRALGYIQPAEEDLTEVSAFISRVLSGASPHVIVKGQRVAMVSGESPPKWLQAAVQSIEVLAPLPPLEALVASTFSDLDMQNMRLAVLPEGDKGVMLGATIKTNVKSPFGESSPIEVKRVGVDIQLLEGSMPQQQRQQQQQRQEGDGGAPARRLQPFDSTFSSALDLSHMRPMGRLVVGEKAVEQKGQTVAIEVQETLTFADQGQAFSSLAVRMMQQTDPVVLGVVGTASVLLRSVIGELHLHDVPIRSLVRVPGLGLLQPKTLGSLAASALESLRISDIKTPLSSSSSGSGGSEKPRALALESTVQLPSLSDMGVELSSLVFTVSFEGEVVAVVTLPSMQLRGSEVSLLDLFGVVKPANNKSFSQLASSFFEGGAYTVSVQGAPSAFEAPADSAEGLALALSGIKSSPPLWVRLVLAGVAFEVPVAPPGGAQQLMRQVDLKGVDVDMSGPRNPFVEAEVEATYSFPQQFNVAHKIEAMEGEMLLFPAKAKEAVGRMAFRKLKVLDQTAVSDDDNRVVLGLDPTELEVFKGMEVPFGALMQETVNSKDRVSVVVRGQVRVSVDTAIGPLTISVPVEMPQSIQGLGGLSGDKASWFFELSNMTVVGADSEFLDAVAEVRLRMPGEDCVLGVDLGRIALDIDLPIPTEVIPMLEQLDENFREANVLPTDPLGPLITTGVVKFDRLMIPSPAKRRKMLKAMGQETADGTLPPDLVRAVLFAPVKTKDGIELKIGTRMLMSNYINSVPTTLVIRSNDHTTENELLIPFFETFRVETVIDGTDMNFIKEVNVTVKFRNFQPLVEAVAVFENPTDANIKFRYAKMETFFNGSSLGPMVIDRRSNPDIIKPRQISRSSPVPIRPQIKDGTFPLMMNVLKSMTSSNSTKPAVQARGEVHIEIETFACKLDIDVPSIPLKLAV